MPREGDYSSGEGEARGVAFTPGPWELCQHLKSLEDDAARPCGYRGVVFGPHRDEAMAICQPGHELPRDEEQWGSEPGRYDRATELANMRLIAAAPDLYAALAAMVALYDADEGCCSLPQVIAARTALARATGDGQ